MASDIDHDIFDYHSSQDYSDVDYQIDLFEIRQSFKCKNQSKQKSKQSSCSLSMKNLKSQSTLVKVKCMNGKQTPRAERKPFRYNHYPTKPSKFFECDEEFQTKPTDAPPNLPSKRLEDKQLQDFSSFRRHFYHVNYQRIKSSLSDNPNIEITDIRLASINEYVQNDFMRRLNEEKPRFPELVYHGTKLNNIENILRYGFLIPNKQHPTNTEAPILIPENILTFSTGIYCCRNAIYSLPYLRTTNTLLVCAALPRRDSMERLRSRYKNNVVTYLTDVTKVIPLFFIDFKYLNRSGINRPLFHERNESTTNENEKAIMQENDVISKRYLRKILALMNDQERKGNQYQTRMFEPFS